MYWIWIWVIDKENIISSDQHWTLNNSPYNLANTSLRPLMFHMPTIWCRPRNTPHTRDCPQSPPCNPAPVRRCPPAPRWTPLPPFPHSHTCTMVNRYWLSSIFKWPQPHPTVMQLSWMRGVTCYVLPPDEGPLGKHDIKLVVEPGPCLAHRRGVGEGADGALHLGQVTARHHRGRLVVDTNLQ